MNNKNLERPLVSVCIPAYNHENYIQQTIKSIINQTYSPIELLVIDDGSKDNTWVRISEMQSECESRFERVELSSQGNAGTCTTLNRLYSNCKGKYVFLIASDDLALPNAIADLVGFLESHPEYALCVGDNDFIDSDGNIVYWDSNSNIVNDKSQATYLSFGEFLQKTHKHVNFDSTDFGSYKNLLINNHVPNGYLIRRSIFNQTGLFNKNAPLEDWWMMLQISKFAKMKYLNKTLFLYRQHASNTVKNIERMKDMGEKTYKYEFKTNKKYIRKLAPKIYWKAKFAFIKRLFGISSVYANEHKYRIITILGIDIKIRLY